MKTPMIVVALLASVALAACGQTYVSGNVTAHTTWGIAGSPYVLQANIVVDAGMVLTIDPGVTVQFETDRSLATAIGASVYAVGTQADPITFTSASPTPAPGDWYAITINNSPSSEFSYCILEYGETNLMISHSSTPVSNCISRYASSCGLTLGEDTTSAVVGCDLINNAKGVQVPLPSNPTINYCNIHDNSVWNLYVSGFPDPPTVTIDAENNWWGSDVELDIVDYIGFGGTAEDNSEVDYDPWLHEMPVEGSSWGRVKALFAE
jgi:hypothetical protein